MIAWLGDGGAGEGGERLVLMPMIDGALATCSFVQTCCNLLISAASTTRQRVTPAQIVHHRNSVVVRRVSSPAVRNFP